MRTHLWGAAWLIALGVVSWSWKKSAAEEVERAAHFPIVEGSNLEKRQFHLPEDFEGGKNLLLVAFEREQQKDVDTWLKEMKTFERLERDFHNYELPTIERPNALTRWFIDSGMRRGIPDRKARERTITLFIDRKPFCEALQISDQREIHQFLVNRKGEVLWRSEGRFDEAKGASLSEAIGKR